MGCIKDSLGTVREADVVSGVVCRYYEGGVSSVYFWNLDDGFAGVVLLKKCTILSPQKFPSELT